jgi:hypothetical protein
MVLQSLLPSRGKSVNQCWRYMATSPTERSWCVLEFARCNSFVAVERAFRRQFGLSGHYMKLQTFLFQMVVTSCNCENLVLKNLWIIYRHPVFYNGNSRTVFCMIKFKSDTALLNCHSPSSFAWCQEEINDSLLQGTNSLTFIHYLYINSSLTFL